MKTTKDAVKNRAQAGGVMYDKQPAGDELFDDVAEQIQSALAISGDDEVTTIGVFQFSLTGLNITGELNEDEWAAMFRGFRRIKRAYLWIVSDALSYAIKRAYRQTREQYEIAAKIIGLSADRLENMVIAARAVEFPRRRGNLSFSHHVEVSPLAEDEQVEWLQKAIDNRWSAKMLRRKIHGEEDGDGDTGAGSFSSMNQRGTQAAVAELIQYIKEDRLHEFPGEKMVMLRSWFNRVDSTYKIVHK